MNSGGSNNLSLKYERYASSGCWDIIKLGFVAKTQFLWARFSRFDDYWIQTDKKSIYIHRRFWVSVVCIILVNNITKL